MKISEIEAGKTYWYCRSRDWDSYASRGYDRYPVRIDDLTRYDYNTMPWGYSAHATEDQRARKDPKGQYLRGTVPGDPDSQYESGREDRVSYVLVRNLRGEYDECMRIIRERREAQEKERVERNAEEAAARDRRDQLAKRAAAAGLTVRVAVETGGGVPRITVEMTEKALVAFLDRLDADDAERGELPDDLPYGS